jgi:N-acetyl sugar amidotransferase
MTEIHNKTYQICSKCVMDTSDSLIFFDIDGVCNHCHLYDKKMALLPKGHDANEQLENLIAKIKVDGQGKDYDCIIGVSGGVDSTYVAYLVKNVYGLRPLAVHLDNGWNSEISVKNIENIVKKLDIDLFTYVIDWEEFRDIQLSFLKASTPDSEIPTDHAIFTILRKLGKKYKIDYVINGINQKTESHHPPMWSQGHSDWKYIKNVHRIFGTKKIKTYPHGNFLTILEDTVSKKWISILNYVDYNKNEAKEIIAKELGWKDYGGKHFESTYTKFFQSYILPVKFGFDKRKMHLSSLICSGEITRNAALDELMQAPYPLGDQNNDREYILKKFGISNEEFQSIMDLPIKSYYDYPSYYGAILKSKYYKGLVSLAKKILKRK